MNGHRSDLTKRTLLLLACKTVVLVIEGWQTTSGLTIPSLHVWCSVFVKRGMLPTVHVQVDLAKRRRERQRPFSTAGALRVNLACGDHISTRTVIKRLHHQGMWARRPIKRPQLILRHRHARFDWSPDHLGWTIRTWRLVHRSAESRFLLRPTDSRARGWRQWNTSFQDNHILGTTAFGGGGAIARGCYSFDCKLNLYVLDGNLINQKYRDNVLA